MERLHTYTRTRRPPYNHRNADGGAKGVAAAATMQQPGDREITRCYYIVLRAL